MKKVFFLASAVAASMSMMAAVDFHYLPTAGDKNAAGTEFTTTDKVAVTAGEKLVEGTNFTVYNAYATTYKVVGMMTDTAYSHLQVGDVTVDFTTQRIQGQDNPTAGGANPVIDMKCPNAGACYKVDIKKDGYIYVAVKSTPNKQQFVFESVTESAGQVAGSMLGYQYLTMSNNTTGTPVGTPDGALCIKYQGDAEYNYLQAPPAMPNAVYGSNYSTNGIGVLCFKVYAEGSPYIVGTAGSKMMACGFGFSEAEVEVKAIGSKGIKTLKPDYAYNDNYDDVVLTNEANIKVADCSDAPIMLRAKIPANETASDDAIWNRTKDGKASINMTAYVTAEGTDPLFISSSKSGNYYVFQVDKLKKFNVRFLAGTVSALTEEGGYKGAYGDTEEIQNVTADACYQIDGFDAANKDQKCIVKTLDCVTGEEITAIDQVEALQVSKKVIGADGQLQLIMADGTVYNAMGTIIK